MSRPTVSAVVATYNCGEYLPEALASLAAQTWRPDEIIVVDDGSTDDTASRMAKSPVKVRYIRQTNQGAAAARNTGIAHATGDYVLNLDADDVCHAERIERQVRAIEARPDAVACFSGHWVFDGAGVRRTSTADARSIAGGSLEHLSRCLTMCPTLVFRRRAAEGLAYPKLRIGEDMVFAALLRTRGNFVTCPEPLYGYRRRANQATQDFSFIENLEHRLRWLATDEWKQYWPEQTRDQLEVRLWRGMAQSLAALYWARDRHKFLALRRYLRARWPRRMARPAELRLHWYPDWIWQAKAWLDSQDVRRVVAVQAER